MEEQDGKKAQNQDEEILNQQEKEQLEGGSESDAAPNEKLDLSDMEEVEGGKINNTTSEDLKKDDGSGGGVVCWC